MKTIFDSILGRIRQKDEIDPGLTINFADFGYTKEQIDTLIAKSVFSEVLVSDPITHNGTGISTKIFETEIDPKLGVEGWMRFAFYASMTGTNAHTFSLRVNNQPILSLAPATVTSFILENILYNKNATTKQGGRNVGGSYGTSGSALLNFDGLIDDNLPMLVSVWTTIAIGDSFTIDRLQLDYRK